MALAAFTCLACGARGLEEIAGFGALPRVTSDCRAFPPGGRIAVCGACGAVISMLDLVISVDTSVAHLAGAMAKAVGVLIPFSPDFRWLLDRTESPWYPTMRLFRQTVPHDWETPLARLKEELAGVVASRQVPAKAPD